MFNSSASSSIFNPVSIIDFFTSLFIMVWIVINSITFVKSFFWMKKDREIKPMLGRQLKRFREKHLKMSRDRVAALMKEDFPEDKIQRQTIANQERAPQLSYILWLYYKTNRILNLEWLFAGEEDDSIPMIKLK
jgi:hypothetical protein